MATIRKIKIKDSLYDIEDWRINTIEGSPVEDSINPISAGAVATLKGELKDSIESAEQRIATLEDGQINISLEDDTLVIN